MGQILVREYFFYRLDLISVDFDSESFSGEILVYLWANLVDFGAKSDISRDIIAQIPSWSTVRHNVTVISICVRVTRFGPKVGQIGPK